VRFRLADTNSKENMETERSKFQLQFISPYSTFQEGGPTPIPFVIDGLLTQGGFSALGAKPKQGKMLLASWFGPLRRFKLAHLEAVKG
jgi:hypothetical protein